MRTRYAIWMAIVVSMIALACNAFGSSPGTPTQAPTAPPTEAPTKVAATPQPTATTAAAQPTPTQSSGATIEIINESGQDIWYVYISPSNADSWGEDRLEDRILYEGETLTLRDISPGMYDMRAEDSSGSAIDVLWDVQINTSFTWVIDVPQVSLEIINDSPDTLVYLYISPTESDMWGDDWLGEAVVRSGQTYVVGGLMPGVYDIRAEDGDGNVIEILYNVNLTGYTSWSLQGPTQLPSGAVLRFEDDFSDNRHNWGNVAEDDRVHYRRPANGEYCINIKIPDLTAWEWYEPFRPDEFVAEVACTVDSDTDASCGLGFGPDGSNLYWFEISPLDQTFALFLLLNGQWQEPLISWTESKNIRPYGWNYLSIERLQGVLYVFANGIMVGNVRTDHFPTGRIGLGGATYNDAPITACMDNLRVWRIER